MRLEEIQKELTKRNIDGWLFYDFHNRDLIAYSILDLDKSKLHTRRWYYFIPAHGEPRKLVHNLESEVLEGLPGTTHKYSQWQQQHTLIKEMLLNTKKIAMQYSPMNAIPYVSLVDAGTIELIRSFGIEVVSSADLVQIFESCISEQAIDTHYEAGKLIHSILNSAWAKIKELTLKDTQFSEYDIQQFIVSQFIEHDLLWEEGAPIVAVNENASNGHYEPTNDKNKLVKRQDLVLIDLWAKLKKPGAIYFDITWMGYVGDSVPDKYVRIFEIAKTARDSAVSFIKEKFMKNENVHGWQVDDVVRNYIVQKGYGNYFVHRTGHCIGESCHGNGVNIDNLETRDERLLMAGNLFSIEPGIYLDEFGVRTEINVYINEQKEVIVTGEKQEKIIPILI